MAQVKVSVVIPTYNGAAEVRRAIDSALAQSGCEVEVIPVNDGSTDDTASVLNSYGSRIRAVHQKNSGPAATRNAGIAAATGDWVAFLDHDDYWQPGKLAAQLAAADRTGADVIYTNAQNFGDVNRVAELRSNPDEMPEGDLFEHLLLDTDGSGQFASQHAVTNRIGFRWKLLCFGPIDGLSKEVNSALGAL